MFKSYVKIRDHQILFMVLVVESMKKIIIGAIQMIIVIQVGYGAHRNLQAAVVVLVVAIVVVSVVAMVVVDMMVAVMVNICELWRDSCLF